MAVDDLSDSRHPQAFSSDEEPPPGEDAVDEDDLDEDEDDEVRAALAF